MITCTQLSTAVSPSFARRSIKMPALGFEQKKQDIQMISDFDDGGSGTIDYGEFLNIMAHKEFLYPKEEMIKTFRYFDGDDTDKIFFKNLQHVTKDLDERMTDEEGASKGVPLEFWVSESVLSVSLSCLCPYGVNPVDHG